MKSKVLLEYPGADIICRFVDYYGQRPHDLKRCNGSFALYIKCRKIICEDHLLFKYGEDFYKYEYVKASIRRTVRRITQMRDAGEIS